MRNNLPLKRVKVFLLTCALFVSSVAVALAINWTALGAVSWTVWYAPMSGSFYAGYTQSSTDRYIYASLLNFTYGSRVNDVNGYIPAIDFDDQQKLGGLHNGLSATAWYATNAPVAGWWRYDDNSDGRYEQVRLGMSGTQIYQNGPSAHYYYDQEYWDPSYPAAPRSGEVNLAAYRVNQWGWRIAHQWGCKFFYETNNLFSRQCQ
jgi:hypothetical protein